MPAGEREETVQSLPGRTQKDRLLVYINEAGKTPLLSKREEVQLAKKIQNGQNEFLYYLLDIPVTFYHLEGAFERATHQGRRGHKGTVNSVFTEPKFWQDDLYQLIFDGLHHVRQITASMDSHNSTYPEIYAVSSTLLKKIVAPYKKKIFQIVQSLNASPYFPDPLIDTLGTAVISSSNVEPERVLRLEMVQATIRAAKDRFIQSNLRLVFSIAWQYVNRGLEVGDLIQEGTLGLMRAVDKFDLRQGTKFSTYATYWIHQRILRGLTDQTRDIRIPYYMLGKIRKMNRMKNCLAQDGNWSLSSEEIERCIGVPIAESADILNASVPPASLDAPVFETDGHAFHDLIQDNRTTSPIEVCSRKQQKREIQKVLKTLTPREELIIKKRFGIGEETSHTLEEIGQLLGLTRERIRQLEERALQKLRQGQARQSLWELASN